VVSDGRFVRRVFLWLGAVALALAAWQLIDTLLLVFAAVLAAVLFRGLADAIASRSPLGPRWALALG
jgi:hypothetical protein